MLLNHHPDNATLVSYSAGALPDSFEIIVACHVRQCPQCQKQVVGAEEVAGQLLDELELVSSMNRQNFMDLLDSEPVVHPQMTTSVTTADEEDPSVRRVPVPKAISQLLNNGSAASVPWRKLAPGIDQINLETLEGNLRILKLKPGTTIPLHTHRGTEMSMVLHGSYSDELGRYKSGDFADVSDDVEHQPIADRHEPCICLIATDAPLEFKGLVPRLMQIYTGL